MFARLFLLFAVLPIVEIALLINVGDRIGGWNTVGLVILTAFVGAYFVRQEGLSTLSQAQRKLQTGGVPGQEMAEGILLIIAGVLLVTPGFITDFIGFLFSLPISRPAIASYLLKHLSVNMVATGGQSGFYQQQQWSNQQNPFQQGNVFDGEFESKADAPLNQNHLERSDIDVQAEEPSGTSADTKPKDPNEK